MNSLLKHRKSGEPILNPFLGLQQEVSRAMNDFYDLFEPHRASLVERLENLKLSPAMDIVEDKDSFKIEIEMPGMGEEDIKVSVSENMLTIEGEKTTSKKDEKKNYVSREICYGRYERSIALPQTADIDKASASFKKGMLWVTIPKKAGSKSSSRKINVEKAK